MNKWNSSSDRIVDTYLDIRSDIIAAGYAHEIDWQDGVEFNGVTESQFLREAAWVVLSAGMSEVVVRRKFNELSPIFFEWESASEIIDSREECRRRALKVFNHRPKISAIVSIAEKIKKSGFDKIRDQIAIGGIDYLTTFNYVGPVTCYHLAKNIGLDVVKPDRHLERIALTLGFQSPTMLCQTISDFTGDKLSVVDIVLWRFATLNRDYLKLFRSVAEA